MIVGVMTVGVLSVGVMTVGVLSVGVMTLSRPIKTINRLKTANCDTCHYLQLSQLDYWFVYFA